MHDIDRTQLEYSHEAGPFQHEEFEFNEFESGMMHEELSEHEEIQLAHELLSVTNEQELEQFLGSFLKRAVSTVGQIARSPIGQAIGGASARPARSCPTDHAGGRGAARSPAAPVVPSRAPS